MHLSFRLRLLALLAILGMGSAFAATAQPVTGHPTLADIDADGDLDLMVLPTDDPWIDFYANTGTPEAPVFAPSASNPFTMGAGLNLALADLDADGDLDLIADRHYYENTGTPQAAVFTLREHAEGNPFANLWAELTGNVYAHLLSDVDADGDADLVVGFEDFGGLGYAENTGTPQSATFTVRTGLDNPFHGLDAGPTTTHAFPAVADFDGDGDGDLLVGRGLFRRASSGFVFFRNDGGRFKLRPDDNPFADLPTDPFSAPALGDLDADGLPELVYVRSGAIEIVDVLQTGTDALPAAPTLDVALFPNPTQARAEVHLTPSAPGPATVELYDVLGRRVAVLHDGPLESGLHRFSIDAASLASGAYVVAVRTAGYQLQRVLVVTH